MRQVLILVPALFLLALIFLGVTMFRSTEANTPCTGEACAQLTDQELADKVIEAKVR